MGQKPILNNGMKVISHVKWANLLTQESMAESLELPLESVPLVEVNLWFGEGDTKMTI